MQLSLNELQAECRKAARGAGLPWGIAEEAGQAVAWLAEHDVNAVPALLDCLAQSGGLASPTHPIRCGISISDHARQLAAGAALSFDRIDQPVLVLPFIALAARLTGAVVTLTHADGAWSALPGGIGAEVLRDAGNRLSIHAVTCRIADRPATTPGQPVRRVFRLVLADDVWQQVQTLAHHTYVPATEQSRLLGAGAGVIDND